ncbi:hypothetical protein PMAYCL1PPCAC_01817, partial [Pristionchus mayeri]
TGMSGDNEDESAGRALLQDRDEAPSEDSNENDDENASIYSHLHPSLQVVIKNAAAEDRPALLEAMSETYSFVFEGLDESSFASKGILKPAR